MLVSELDSRLDSEGAVCPLRKLSVLQDARNASKKTRKPVYHRYLMILCDIFSGLCWKG